MLPDAIATLRQAMCTHPVEGLRNIFREPPVRFVCDRCRQVFPLGWTTDRVREETSKSFAEMQLVVARRLLERTRR